ncbi:hypothetical protein CNR22_04420 [Sphingobacteriaceae bacterium]|nr:hypothetical protein CNR22_04420 [Sphingobacteriaceae bacterium]
MKKIPSFLFLAGFCIPVLLSSCSGSCNCQREIRCTTLTAIEQNSGEVVEKKIFCSIGDYRADQAFQDSIGRFHKRHYSDNSSLLQKDSVLSSESKTQVKIKDVQSVEKNGFYCICAK